MTNDGNSILREVDVSHPAAKSMIELARAQVPPLKKCPRESTIVFTPRRVYCATLCRTKKLVMEPPP